MILPKNLVLEKKFLIIYLILKRNGNSAHILEKIYLGKIGYLAKLSTGIGQGYIQTTPIQLCLMMSQIANGGYKIYPKLVLNEQNENNYEDKFIPLFKNSKNIKIIQDAIFSSTNEIRGTSYSSRIDDVRYQFAGKTGTAQVKRITEKDREMDLKTSQIPYEERDHALYVAYGPCINPDMH